MAGDDDDFFIIANKLGFLEEASRRGIEPIMMFLIDPDQKSSAAYSILQRWFADISLLPVRNQLVERRGFNGAADGGQPLDVCPPGPYGSLVSDMLAVP